MRYTSHDFYCCHCGHKGIPVQRPNNQKRERFHKKRLYCLTCGGVVNHVEVRNDSERQKFFEKFLNGEYENEKVIFDGRVSCVW